MQTSAAWMSDTPPLACLSGLGHREALQRLRDDPAARAEMTASPQWSAAHRWADQWASTDQAYYVALRRGFAAQYDVRRGVMTLSAAERWALPQGQPSRLSYFDSRAATPLRGADIGPPTFAGDWIRGWLADLERHVLPAPPTAASYAALMTAGVDLLTWLGTTCPRSPRGLAPRIRACGRSGAPGVSSRRPASVAFRPIPSGGCTLARLPTGIRAVARSASCNGWRAAAGSNKYAPSPSSRCRGL
jgi:hypothetical protein